MNPPPLNNNINIQTTVIILDGVAALLAPHADSWATLNFPDMLHGKQAELDVPSRAFMSVLRHALTGRKDGPAVADIMKVLGYERTLIRLSRS